MFVKLFTQILDSSIADDRKLRHFFTDLLLCADCKGYIIMTPAAIARRIGASVDEVEWGISELEKPDPNSKTKDGKGKRIEPLGKSGYGWRIINYESYRALKDADQMREATRRRVNRHRAKKKDVTLCNADVTLCNANTEADTEEEANTDKKNNNNDQTTNLRIRLGGIYARKPETKWSDKEVKSLKSLKIDPDDLLLIEEFYRAESTPAQDLYRRTSLLTLINNWNGEVDKAKNWKSSNTKNRFAGIQEQIELP